MVATDPRVGANFAYCKAFGRVVAQQPCYELAQARGKIVRKFEGATKNFFVKLRVGLRAEWKRAADHSVEDHTHAPHVHWFPQIL